MCTACWRIATHQEMAVLPNILGDPAKTPPIKYQDPLTCDSKPILDPQWFYGVKFKEHTPVPVNKTAMNFCVETFDGLLQQGLPLVAKDYDFVPINVIAGLNQRGFLKPASSDIMSESQPHSHTEKRRTMSS